MDKKRRLGKMGKTAVIYLVLVFAFASSQARVVTLPEGPLVRVTGQRVTVKCEVSDYEGPQEQDFEWRVVQGGKPYQIVSTFDRGYSDQRFQDRIASGDISLNRLAGDAVELVFKKAKAADSGVYFCFTPSTDSSVVGNYESNVQLKVIGDSLKVVPVPAPALVLEGNPLELRCNISRSLAECTGVSITWSVKRGPSSAPEEVLTFGPGDVKKAGPGYAGRGLRLDTLEGGLYGLVLPEATPTDNGSYLCTAREWTLEVGGDWQNIVEKSAEIGGVAVTPVAASLRGSVENNTSVSEGDDVHLTCLVASGNHGSLALEVTWFVSPTSDGVPKDGRVLAHVSRDGLVSTNGSDLVRLSRVDVGRFRLLLQDVDRSSSGFYSCRVRAWIHQTGSGWYQAAEITPNPVEVKVTQIDPEFRIALSGPVVPQFSGDPTELECGVTNVTGLGTGRLAVSWVYTEATPGDSPVATRVIAVLDMHGGLVPGEAYRQRFKKGMVVLSRDQGADTFRMRFLQTLDSDTGLYICKVSAWTPTRDGGWTESKVAQSGSFELHWSFKNPTLGVTAVALREASSAGATFEMGCDVKAENLQDPGYSVLVRREGAAGGKTQKIVSLSPDSAVKLEEWSELDRLDSVVLEKTGPGKFRFRLYGAQVSDGGLYCCEVAAWTRDMSQSWNKVVSAESNKVQIAFSESGPAFNVSIHLDTARIYPGGTAKMACVITALGATPNAGDVSYEVKWYRSSVQGMEGPALLASMDRWGVVRKPQRAADPADLSVERQDAGTFGLGVHSAQDIHAGAYHCMATPWLRSSDGTWTRGHDLVSSEVFLVVNISLWDSLKMPLLYGVLASLAVGLFSLLVGYVGARCCLRKSTRNKSHNKLMDLEMD